jgi:hypothetical protein
MRLRALLVVVVLAVVSATSSSCQLPLGQWVQLPLPGPPGVGSRDTAVADEVSCTREGFCYVAARWQIGDRAGRFGRSWHNGTWRSVPELPVSSFGQLSCASPTTCAVGSVNNAAAFDGDTVTWLYPPSPGGGNVSAQSIGIVVAAACGAPDHCVALPWGMSIWDGRQWSARESTPVLAEQLSCVTTTFCLGADAYGVHRWDGASNWTPSPFPGQRTTDERLNALTCWAVDRCLIITSYPRVYAFDGTGLSPVSAPEGLGQVSSASCVAERRCVAARGSAPPMRLDASGWHESPTPVPAGYEQVSIRDVSCATGWCMAVGTASRADGASTAVAYRLAI